jgi:diaminopimelate decarboxylase
MSFVHRNGVLCAEQVPLDAIAERYGTPCYVYSRSAIEAAFAEYAEALGGRDARICYSVKANSNLSVLSLLMGLGTGFDIVSGGELARVMAAGGEPGKTLFSGVGKTEAEIEQALRAGIGCLNLESEAELARVDAIGRRLGLRAPVAFRVNPDVDARTHPYISTGLRENKFGVAHDDAERLYRAASGMPGVEVVGIGCHIGSQLTDAAPFVAAVERLVGLADRIERAGMPLRHIDVGGGIGIRYRDEKVQPPGAFVAGALRALGERRKQLILDPGRSLVGNAGVLVTRVEYVKPGSARSFLVVDAAMNDLLRPSLYGAWHDVQPVRQRPDDAETLYDIVGPVCESGDFLARERRLAARQGDVIAVMSAGAYGMCMSSNYNSRPRAAEVMVQGTETRLVRNREKLQSLYAEEELVRW